MPCSFSRLAILSSACLVALSLHASRALSQDKEKTHSSGVPALKVWVDSDATVHLPPMTVPYSSLASPEAKAAYLKGVQAAKDFEKMGQSLSIAEQRKWTNDYLQPALKRVKTLYPVESVPTTIAGVYTDVITPKEGIAVQNRNRVLINVHGGGFEMGARIVGALEAIPVASLAKIKVITVDYREGPENKFPAASEDVAAVYKELLKTYKSQNIGIYGCSAGGVLTGEATAWIAKQGLPRPGAIGIFCASAEGWTGGDSGVLAGPLMGETPSKKETAGPHPSVSNVAYFSDADASDPMVQPIRSAAVLGQFPPTLLITSTRDFALSPAAHTHIQLVKLGVDAQLFVWEGMPHGFFTTEPDLPETKEALNVIVKFFESRLGK